MRKVKGRPPKQTRRAPELNAQQVEARLLASSFPRLHMVLILTVAALGTFLSSALMVSLNLQSMGIRYILAVIGGYAYFLLALRLWIAWQTRNWRFGRNARQPTQHSTQEKASFDGNVDVPDLSALADFAGNSTEKFVGGGGEFGGAGASASFGDSGGDSGSSSFDVSGGDGEGVAIVIAIVAVLGGMIALGFVVYASPALFAEVLLDVAVLGAVYKKNKAHERGHWAAGVLGRTYKPALVLAVFAAILGFSLQSLAPEEETLGAVLEAHNYALDKH